MSLGHGNKSRGYVRTISEPIGKGGECGEDESTCLVQRGQRLFSSSLHLLCYVAVQKLAFSSFFSKDVSGLEFSAKSPDF